MIISKIEKSYNLARKYVKRCCIKVNQDGHTIQAFTEFEGKMRVTDWGGTSSALCLFNQIGTSGDFEILDKIEKSKEWLISNQSKDGAWEAAEMYCCEATAAVIYDLKDTNYLSNTKVEQAMSYIQNCYVEKCGYFLSQPKISQYPHLYTTFLAVRTLSTINHASFTPEKKEKIIKWIGNARSADGLWGATPQAIEGDIAHTIFALLILYYCGLETKIIKKTYKKQIRWIKKQIKICTSITNAFIYEAIEVYNDLKKDSYGEGAYILKSYHFTIALICNLFLIFEDLSVSQRLIKKIINLQSQNGGWGLKNEGKEFVWATQQAVNCLYTFKKKII